MNTETRCRILCKSSNQDPDAHAPAAFQLIPKPKEAGAGPVLNWMTWISTVEAERKPADTVKPEARRKAKLQRTIDESTPGRQTKPKYSCND